MNQKNANEIDVLRAHAIAAALHRAKPEDYLVNETARLTWYKAVTEVAGVVCSAQGASYSKFFNLCGVPD